MGAAKGFTNRLLFLTDTLWTCLEGSLTQTTSPKTFYLSQCLAYQEKVLLLLVSLDLATDRGLAIMVVPWWWWASLALLRLAKMTLVRRKEHSIDWLAWKASTQQKRSKLTANLPRELQKLSIEIGFEPTRANAMHIWRIRFKCISITTRTLYLTDLMVVETLTFASSVFFSQFAGLLRVSCGFPNSDIPTAGPTSAPPRLAPHTPDLFLDTVCTFS